MIQKGAKLGLHCVRMSSTTMNFINNISCDIPVIKGVDDIGWFTEVRTKHPNIITIARFTSEWEGCEGIDGSGVDIDLYAERLMSVIIEKKRLNPAVQVDYWEVCNEPDPPTLQGYTNLSKIMIKCMNIANTNNMKLAIFSLNAGTPEYNEMQAMVDTGVFSIAKAGGHILSLHEGLLDPDGDIRDGIGETIPGAPGPLVNAGYMAFRHRFLYDMLEKKNQVVPLIISEGYFQNYSNVTKLIDFMSWYDEISSIYSYHLGNLFFTVSPVGQWYNQNYEYALPQIKTYMESVKDRVNMTNTFPPVDPPINGDNMLLNSSFEDTWYHWHIDNNGNYHLPWDIPSGVETYPVPELQIPSHWRLFWREGNVNPEGQPYPYIRPEVRVWPKNQAPSSLIKWDDSYSHLTEQELFFPDGDQTLKVFKGSGAVNFDVWQELPLDAGVYEFTLRIFPDLVRYYDGDKKVWAMDQPGEVLIAVNGIAKTDWITVKAGEWNTYSCQISHTGGLLKVGFGVNGRWALQNNGWFIDNLQLEKIEDTTLPPVTPPPTVRDYKVTYFLASQSINDTDRAAVNEWVWSGLNDISVEEFNKPLYVESTLGKHVLTYSHLDAIHSVLEGKDGSWLYIVNPGTIGTGITWQWLQDNFPTIVSRTKFINTNSHVFSFARPVYDPYVVTSEFGEERSYTGDHEGIDLVAQGDKNIYAIESGVVERVNTSSGYGKYVRVSHDGIYKSWYSHLSVQSVVEGQIVTKGQKLGVQGSTGNSTGEHLHLTIQHIGHGLSGFVVDDVINPRDIIEFKPKGDTGGTGGYTGVPVVYKAGIHGPGSDGMWQQPAFKDMMGYLAMPSLYLSNGINVDHATDTTNSIVRMFPNINPNDIKNPQQMWNELKPDIARWWNKGFRKFIPFNEPNLPSEGWGNHWHNPTDFANYLNAFLQLVLVDYPSMKVYHTPMSPQPGPWGTQEQWYDASWSKNKGLCYGFCIHAYTDPAQGIELNVHDIVNQTLNLQRKYSLKHPLIVGESSVNRPASDNHKALVYRNIDVTMKTKKGIEHVFWYISHWNDDVNKENWFGTSIPQLYKANT